jgi:hypothetical protein
MQALHACPFLKALVGEEPPPHRHIPAMLAGRTIQHAHGDTGAAGCVYGLHVLTAVSRLFEMH